MVVFIILCVSYWPRFCYELPSEFTAAICVRGLPSVPMNRPAGSIVNEARIIVDHFDCKTTYWK